MAEEPEDVELGAEPEEAQEVQEAEAVGEEEEAQSTPAVPTIAVEDFSDRTEPTAADEGARTQTPAEQTPANEAVRAQTPVEWAAVENAVRALLTARTAFDEAHSILLDLRKAEDSPVDGLNAAKAEVLAEGKKLHAAYQVAIEQHDLLLARQGKEAKSTAAVVSELEQRIAQGDESEQEALATAQQTVSLLQDSLFEAENTANKLRAELTQSQALLDDINETIFEERHTDEVGQADELPQLKVATPPRLSEIDNSQVDLELLLQRKAVIEEYQSAQNAMIACQQRNSELQQLLVEFFRKRQKDEREVSRSKTEQEQRYAHLLTTLQEFEASSSQTTEQDQKQLAAITEKLKAKQQQVDTTYQEFSALRKSTALAAVFQRNGKALSQAQFSELEERESTVARQLFEERVKFFKARNVLAAEEQELKARDELAQGLHLMDFEQLKAENQSHNEKIEERNEELLRIRKKITNTIHVLAHLKEKQHFIERRNRQLQAEVKQIETDVAQKRDHISQLKRSRDKGVQEAGKLKQDCGLIGNDTLLRDFEQGKDSIDDLQAQLEELKAQHAETLRLARGFSAKLERFGQSQTIGQTSMFPPAAPASASSAHRQSSLPSKRTSLTMTL
eukprot:m.256055 g.256055  ORF g.256055 m.256055 type:complete len:621 (-) comp54549_c0_seq3:27-1889(-)